ncbi:pirin family protein, partial [Streptomyces nigra]
MSNLDREAVPSVCGGRGFVVAEPVRELLSPRRVRLGESSEVRRLLPNLGRRMVGAWCFVDHYGPDDIADEPGMQVPPHPHMGLQTVSWLHEGEVLHRDSTGSLQTIRPRELGLMTSGWPPEAHLVFAPPRSAGRLRRTRCSPRPRRG